MKLGTLTFEWDPDKYTIPEEKRDTASVQTYTSVAFFSWGSQIIGQKITLEWDWMPADQYLRIKQLEAADAQIEWDTEADNRLFYSGGVNTPFVFDRIITGGISAATARVESVDTRGNNLLLTLITGAFQNGETITDNSILAKSATITSLEIIPIYNVEILSVEGEYFEVIGSDITYRKNTKLTLLIMSEA